MTHTIQTISNIEKAKQMIEINSKAESDLLLYWHYQTIKSDLIDEYLTDLR
jgi:hypothetical protein